MPLPLTDARWRRLETLFSAASALHANEREAFVSRETAGDPELERELRGMLAAGPGAAAAIAGVIGRVAAGLADGWAGRRLGPYRIVRQIGRGGMGIVFEAVRGDDEYRKTVALKVPPPWSDPVLVGERFRLERQILAELEHPNIAHLLDGGTEDGMPYFVMEYVEGVPITEYCDRHALGLPERLRLFLQVCGAVGFAHQRLVVHRDLKPANILVGHGALKLLDFGIAKLLDPLVETSRTATIETRWTPDYTSPEQVHGRAVTTRTDVYSLGLILYELLTGERGQIADTTSPVTIERSICETQPARPSERVSRRDPARSRALRGDLDTVVMTALAKEPERRYASVAALAEDVNRFLDGRPILARPSTAGYRARKFLRRHRVGVAAAVLVMVSLVVGLGAAVYEWRQADRRFQQVRALANTFVFDVHDQIESLPGATRARKTIVQTALVYLESLRKDAKTDPGLARDLAAAYEKVGDAQGVPDRANLGDSAGALVSLTHARELLVPLADHGDREARRRLVSIDTSIAMVKESNGDAAGAAESAARGQTIGEKLLLETPDDRDLLAALIDNYSTRARAAANRGDLEGGERAAGRCLALAERLVTLAPANLQYRDDAASAHNALGQALQAGPGLEEAIDHYNASIRIREQLVAESPDNLDFKRELMVSYGNLGDVLDYQPGRNIGDQAGSAAAFQKAIAIAEWARAKDPADHRALYDVAAARLRLGAVEAGNASSITDALGQLRQAQQICSRLSSEDPRSDRFAVLCGAIDLRMGETLERTGRYRDAQRQFEAARNAAGHMSTASIKRSAMVNSAVHLAYLKAGQPDAAALAVYAAGELTARPVSTPFVDAALREDLGRAYTAIAEKSARAERQAWNAKAAAAFEDSLRHWQTLKVPPPVERQRADHMSVIERRLEALKKKG